MTKFTLKIDSPDQQNKCRRVLKLTTNTHPLGKALTEPPHRRPKQWNVVVKPAQWPRGRVSAPGLGGRGLDSLARSYSTKEMGPNTSLPGTQQISIGLGGACWVTDPGALYMGCDAQVAAPVQVPIRVTTNRCVLGLVCNIVIESMFLITGGREFQGWGRGRCTDHWLCCF